MLKILRLKVMSSKQAQKLTLLQKIAKKQLKEKAKEEVDVPDIEDAAGKASPYFSPLQTRNQRKLKNLEAITIVPTTETEVKPKPKKINKKAKDVEKMALLETKQKPMIAEKSKVKVERMQETATPLVEEETAEQQWSPKNWQQALQNIRQMRANETAPVDTMGCDKCADDSLDEKTQRFQKLVALMLSSQTKDETTFEAMKRLKAHTLTPQALIAVPAFELEQLLHPVSFYKNKAKYLQKVAQILIDKYDSDIPHNIKELVALPGVGPKMAHICMSTAWGEITGIGVDVHVHRITNRLHWLPRQTKEPEQTRIALEQWLPKDLWAEVNHLLVGFGQTVCTPLRPHCADCLNRLICPSAEVVAATGKKKNEASIFGNLSPIKKSKFQPKKM